MAIFNFRNGEEVVGEPQAANLAILHISRSEIERCDTRSSLESLHRLTDSTATVDSLEGGLVMSVDGYDMDPRELCEIPEVCAYFQHLTSAWAYWFHFLAIEDGSLFAILQILLEMEVIARDGDAVAFQIKERTGSSMKRVLFGLYEAMNQLHIAHGIDDARTTRRTIQINQVLDTSIQ